MVQRKDLLRQQHRLQDVLPQVEGELCPERRGPHRGLQHMGLLRMGLHNMGPGRTGLWAAFFLEVERRMGPERTGLERSDREGPVGGKDRHSNHRRL